MAVPGPDPCRGCKLRRRTGWQPEYFTSVYAAYLAEYLENLRPAPQEISWRDLELYKAFVTAREEYLAAKEKTIAGSKKNMTE